jgi:ABC-type transport system involved in multi-copper enzyme maturation permease subunit
MKALHQISFKIVWTLIKKEWVLIIREPKFWLPFLLPPVFMMGAQIFLQVEYGAEALGAGNSAGGFSPEPSMLLFIGALLSSMGIGLTADSFAGERERKSLELLLDLPVSLLALFGAKLMVAVSVPLLFAVFWQAIFWLNMHNASWFLLGVSIVFSISFLLLSSGISLVFSLLFETVRSAAQSSMVLFIVMLFAVQLLAPWYFTTEWAWWAVPLLGLGLFGIVLFASFTMFQKVGSKL